MRIFQCCAVVLALSAGTTFAQTTRTADQRLDDLERRLNESESQHKAELQSRDEEIARLKQQINASPSAKPTSNPASSSSSTTPADEIDKTKQDILQDIETNRGSPLTLRTPANFNPDLAVIGNFVGNISTANDNPARNRFGLSELELEMRAAVDPKADAVVALPFTREVDDPLFFNKATANGDINTSFDIEEAYLFLHDFGVPNLTAKVGRFHLRFGRQNILHDHDLPTADNNFVNQSFLGSEAVVGDGLSLSYVVPPNLIANQYVELIAEIISGEGSDDQPVINNDASVDSPAMNLHALWNHDFAKDWNVEVGGSWLSGKHDDDNQQNANLFGADLTLIHVDPTGGFFNQLIQFEGIHGNVGTSSSDTQHSSGAYLLVQQQINRDWYAGVRLDWTQNALDDKQEVWGVSPYVTWYWSEFLRFRLEYQHKDGDVPSEDTLFFQATWVFGAHPPHPYWAMK